MAELANRDKIESRMANVLARLGAKQRKELERLLGNPPDIKRVPAGWWLDKERELEDAALVLFFLPFEKSAIQHGLAPSLAKERAALFVEKRSGMFATGFMAHSRDMLKTGSKSWTPNERVTANDIRNTTLKIYGPRRFATIGKTETSFAQEGGSDDAIKEQDLIVTKWWRHSRFSPKGHAGAAIDPCPICTPRLDTPESQWGGLEPGTAHANCVLPSQVVSIPGKLLAASKAFYDGRCVEISLANGSNLSVTENHPILTSGGWKAAVALVEGDDVVCCRSGDGIFRSINPHNDYRPTEIEKVFASLKMSSGMVSSRMPTTSEDFHGDGRSINGQIEIVWADRKLLSDRQSARDKHIVENRLGLTDVISRSGSSDRRPRLTFNRNDRAFGCRVCRSVLTGSLAFGSIFPSDEASLSASTNRDAGLQQHSPYRGTSYTEAGGDGVLGFTGQISTDDRRVPARKSESPPSLVASTDVAMSKHLRVEGWRSDASLAREFCYRFASEISLSQISKVRRFNYSGHVYDLQVETNHLYICNGVIVHNCDCFREYQDEDGKVLFYD